MFKTVVSPLLMHQRYCSLALGYLFLQMSCKVYNFSRLQRVNTHRLVSHHHSYVSWYMYIIPFVNFAVRTSEVLVFSLSSVWNEKVQSSPVSHIKQMTYEWTITLIKLQTNEMSSRQPLLGLKSWNPVPLVQVMAWCSQATNMPLPPLNEPMLIQI